MCSRVCSAPTGGPDIRTPSRRELLQRIDNGRSLISTFADRSKPHISHLIAGSRPHISHLIAGSRLHISHLIAGSRLHISRFIAGSRPHISHLFAGSRPYLSHISQRTGLHAVVVVLVVSCAVVGGGRFSSATIASQQSDASAGTALQFNVVVAPVVTQTALASPARVAVATPAAGQPSPAAAAAQPSLSSSSDPVRLALGLPDPAGLVKIEDGVVVARSVVSSRGGARSPEAAPPTPTPAPSPVPSPAPTQAPKKDFSIKTYKVQEGDSLIGIATRFGITPETVLWANDIRSADLLQIGQELKILPVSGVLHTVGKGETLGGIADAYVADRAKVVEVNTIPNADSLQEGQLLIIPGGMLRTTGISGPPAAPSAQDLASASKYTVKQGDTLLTIADAFGVRVSTIQAANGLMDPDMLRIGLVLSIPGGSQQPAPAAKPQAAPAPKPAPAPAPPPPPPAGSIGDQIAAIAQQYVGYRYVWGGHSPSGFDCSGFTWYVYKQAGISIPLHDLWGQIGAGPKISRADLQPGDLLFWANTYTPGLSHGGIYLGGGRFINAETEEVGVQIRSLNDPYWSARFYGASRPR